VLALLAGLALGAAGCAKDDGANIRRPPASTTPTRATDP
jgi:hypothetical protein